MPTLPERAQSAFEAGDYDSAIDLYRELVERDPRDPLAHYNLACALAQSSQPQDASEHLLEAVSVGFTHFHEMRRDESLRPINGHPTYKEIVAHIPAILDARGEAEFNQLTDKSSAAYRTARDPELRLNFASASDEESFAYAREEVGRVARWWQSNLFEGGPAEPDDPWVTVLMPTPEDFFRLVRGASGVGGYYDRDARRLVTQDAGPTLRHEFFHVLHHRHQARSGQKHPLWIQEGLASLLEDVDWDAADGVTVLPSWRTNSAARLARTTRFPPIERLARMGDERFSRQRPKANYAISRAFFMFLLEREQLGPWYETYRRTHDEDPSGVLAIEQTLGKPMREINREFRVWLRDLPIVGERLRPGDASLGVDIRAGRGSGPVVSIRALDWNRSAPTPLRSNDVIKSIGGQDVRSIDDLFRILGEHEPGETVTVRVSRWSKIVEMAVKLVENTP